MCLPWIVNDVTQGNWKWHHSIDRVVILTMAISCIVSEIKRDICRKRYFFIPTPFNLHGHLEHRRFCPKISTQTVRVPKLLDGAKILAKSSTL